MKIRTPGNWSLTLCALLFAACGSEPETPAAEAPDLIVINADVHTVDAQTPYSEAFAVSDGRFSAIGDTEDIRSLADEETQIIDVNGASIVPGFIDAHSHVSGNAPVVAGVDLSYVVEKADWLELIKAADERLPEGAWLTGGFWDHTLSDGEYPTRQMLDSVLPDRPAFLSHIDGHYGWVNTAALELSGVTAETPVPPGGEIVLDPDTGEPTGILLEGAMGVVRDNIPDRSEEDRRAGLAKMQAHANSFGVTGLHQMGSLQDYLHIIETGDPTLRVWYGTYPQFEGDAPLQNAVEAILAEQEDAAARVNAAKDLSVTGPLLEVGYVKMLNDGVLSAHTAVLEEAYADRPDWRGEYRMSPDEMNARVEALTTAGIPVAIHSIGDAAVSATLDAFEAARDNSVPHPNRIEHIEVTLPEDIARFKELGIVASMQPNHATNSIAYVPVRLGPERTSNAYIWRSFLDADVTLAFSSDYPTSPLSPLSQIADAMFRISPFGLNDGEPWHPEQAVSFEEALRAYTLTPAEISAWGDEIGSIEVGKWADFAVLDGAVPQPVDEHFRDLGVAETYLAGRKVFEAE